MCILIRLFKGELRSRMKSKLNSQFPPKYILICNLQVLSLIYDKVYSNLTGERSLSLFQSHANTTNIPRLLYLMCVDSIYTRNIIPPFQDARGMLEYGGKEVLLLLIGSITFEEGFEPPNWSCSVPLYSWDGVHTTADDSPISVNLVGVISGLNLPNLLHSIQAPFQSNLEGQISL